MNSYCNNNNNINIKMLYNTTLKNVVRVNNFKRLLSVKVMGDESAFNNVHKV